MTAPRCGECGRAVAVDDWNRGSALPCVQCDAPVQSWVFAAAWANPAGSAPEALDGAEAASCLNHPRNLAVAACARCGRFVCPVCVSGNVCNACFDRGTEERDPQFMQRATLHDGIALAIAVLPVFTLVLVVLTAPMAFLYTLITWSKTRTAVPRGNQRKWLALGASGLSLVVGLGLFFWVIITSAETNPR